MAKFITYIFLFVYFQHLRLALSDSSPSTHSKFDLRFHIAHIFELQKKFKTAKESYDHLLKESDLPSVVKANTLRQLGEFYTFIYCFN